MPGMEPISDDLIELIALFREKGVEFLVVGAHALAFYALPRQTEDLDLWIRRSQLNAERVQEALGEFGFTISDEDKGVLTRDQNMLRLGHPPHQVDIMTFLDGCNFDEAWGRKVAGKIMNEDVYFLSLADYIKTKRASGRPKDLSDLERLEEHLGGLPQD